MKKIIPVTTLYEMKKAKKLENAFYGDDGSILLPDQKQPLEIQTRSLVRLTLVGQYYCQGNAVFISFAVNGVPICPQYLDRQPIIEWATYYTQSSEYTPIKIEQKIILEPNTYIISIIGHSIRSSGKQLYLVGVGMQIEIQTQIQSS
ncbi:hypothetical protein ABPG72_007460 [Tetrahymena utriculariae]